MYKFSDLSNSQVDDMVNYIVDDLTELHTSNAHNEFGYYYTPKINLVDEELVIVLVKNFDYLPDAELELEVIEYEDGSYDLLCNVIQVYYNESTTVWKDSSKYDFADIIADTKSAMSYLDTINGIMYELDDIIDLNDDIE